MRGDETARLQQAAAAEKWPRPPGPWVSKASLDFVGASKGPQGTQEIFWIPWTSLASVLGPIDKPGD